MYEISYDYVDSEGAEHRNAVVTFAGTWKDLRARIKAMRAHGCYNIIPTEVRDDDDEPVKPLGDVYVATVTVCESGGNEPHLDPENGCAYLYAADVEANADNPGVIYERGARQLVIEVYRDHWHVAQVRGYIEAGLFERNY